MYEDCAVVVITDEPSRKHGSKYSKYTKLSILEYSTANTSIDSIVKDFYTKYSKTGSRIVVIYDGTLYRDRLAALVGNCADIIAVYTRYHAASVYPSNVLMIRPSYRLLCRMIAAFCMYLPADIFVQVGDTIGLSDYMSTMNYYRSKVLVKCDVNNTDDIAGLTSTGKKIATIVDSTGLSKHDIVTILDEVDSDLTVLLFCNYSIHTKKTVLQIYDPFHLESVIDVCNGYHKKVQCQDIEVDNYSLSVMQLNDKYLRDLILDDYGQESLHRLHSSLHIYSQESGTSVARKYKVNCYPYDNDRVIVWQERLNCYENSLVYSTEDMIGCTAYSTIDIDGHIYPSTVLELSAELTVQKIDAPDARKNNRY